MTKLVNKLSSELILSLKKADEIWIAVALLNSVGLKFILENVKKECLQNYLIGIDLPTDPTALKKLHALEQKSNIRVRIYTKREYFHPKLYLIRIGNIYRGYLGSANCTNGGLYSNIELSLYTNQFSTCEQLKDWFIKLYGHSQPLSKKFLFKYASDYYKIKNRKKEEERLARERKQELQIEAQATFKEKNKFIRLLKSYRTLKKYTIIKKERENAVQQIRLALDYPKFNNINLELFFSIWKLGHLISISKPVIKRQPAKFRKLLLMLCDENKDISVRYDLAQGKMKVDGVSDGTISKILTIHRPDLYYVKNSKTTTTLHKYGIQLSRGLSLGEKYKITCKALQQVCTDTDIDNLAVLDQFLYIEGDTTN